MLHPRTPVTFRYKYVTYHCPQTDSQQSACRSPAIYS